MFTFEQAFAGRYGYAKPFKPMTGDLEDRVIVVTGAGGMIGGAIADRLAANGARIAVADINRRLGEAQADKIISAGGRAEFFAVDLMSRDSIDELVDRVAGHYGRIDILINNAGINGTNRKNILGFSDKNYEDNINCNLTGSTFYISKKVIPYMIKQGGGRIINTTSVNGVTGIRGQCGFVAAKFAVSALTKSMALEYGRYNILVNAVAPGALPAPWAEFYHEPVTPATFWTKMWSKISFDDYESNFERRDNMLFDMPARRPAYPTDMAGVYLYLCCDDSCYTTGQVIAVDGGWICGYSADY